MRRRTSESLAFSETAVSENATPTPKILAKAGVLPGLEALMAPARTVATETSPPPPKARKPRAKPEAAPERRSGAAMTFDEFIAGPAKKRGKPNPRLAQTRARAELIRLREEGRLPEFQGRHFVAFYLELHAHVYKVEASELDGVEWWAAVTSAEKLLVSAFDGDRGKMLDFMRWTWQREKWKAANADSPRRYVWRWQFSTSAVTDYRVATRM